MNSRIRPGERHANIVDYYCNSALVRRWGRLLRIFPLGSRRRRRIRRRRTVGHSYSVPNAQAVSSCISIGDESQAKPAGCSTLTRPTKSKLFYSCSLPILWLLAVVADHLQTRHDVTLECLSYFPGGGVDFCFMFASESLNLVIIFFCKRHPKLIAAYCKRNSKLVLCS